MQYTFRQTHWYRSLLWLQVVEYIAFTRRNWSYWDHIIAGCDRLLTTVKYKWDIYANICNDNEVTAWLKSRYSSFPLHAICYRTSDTAQRIPDCIQEHGKVCTTTIDDQQMMALHILCGNHHAAIQVCLQLALEASNVQDLNGITPFQHLCRNNVTSKTFLRWWFGGTIACLPWPKWTRSESVNDHDEAIINRIISPGWTMRCTSSTRKERRLLVIRRMHSCNII